MTRQESIEKGKFWQVYNDGDDNIIFEGSKTKCLKYIKDNFGMKNYKNGSIRLGKLIIEF